MISGWYSKFENFIFLKCEQFSRLNNWVLLLSLMMPVFALFLAFPSYDRLGSQFSDTWQAVMTQTAHPFTPHYYDPGSHESKLAFRLTVPVIANILGLGITGILILQGIAGWLIFYFSINIFRRISKDPVTAILLTFSLLFIYAGKVSYTEIRGIFDGFALFFLVLSLASRNPLIIFCAIMLAAWTDERGLIASSLVFLYWFLHNRKIISVQSIAIIIAWAGYFLLRYLASSYYNLSTPTEGLGIGRIFDHTNNIPIGTWSALEGYWLLVIASIILLFRQRQYLSFTLFIASMGVIVLVALSVIDITRSMAYTLPAIFVALLIVSRVELTHNLRKLALVVMLISFAYPAYYTSGAYSIQWCYPFPLQALRYFLGPGV